MIEKIRSQYPQYNDLSDKELADALHAKFYSDMDQGEYYKKVGLQENQEVDDGNIPKKPAVKDYARTVFDQGMQGATFGFADEVSDRIGAGIASLYTGQPYSEMLEEARSTTQDRLEEQMQEMPVTSLVSNLGGGLLTGAAGATTKAGGAVGNFLRSGNTTSRVAKSTIAGAASGATYGAGTGEDGERLQSAGQGALYGGVAGAAIPAIGSTLSKLNTRTIVPTANKIKKSAQDLYAKARNHGAEFLDDATTELRKVVQEQIPTDAFARQVIGEDEISAFAKRLDDVHGEKMSLDSFENLDKWLGSSVQKAARTGDNDLARRYGDIQGKLRDIVDDEKFIQGSKEGIAAYKEATKQWRSYAKMRDVEQILENAEYYNGGTAAGIKSGFTRLAKQINSGKLRGYSREEIKAIKSAAKTGRTEGLFRTFGSRLLPIVGGAAGGPKGALLGYAASEASQVGAGALRGAEASKIGKLIAKNTGLVEKQQRIPIGKLREIMKLPPSEARLALEKINQTNQ